MESLLNNFKIIKFWKFLMSVCFLINIVEFRLSDIRLSDFQFYPTRRVGRLHFVNSPTHHVAEWVTLPYYTPPVFYVLRCNYYRCTALQALARPCHKKKKKRKRLRSKYPFLFSSKNKLFHLQVYMMINAIFVRFFIWSRYCIFLVI
jgi:hypothetical protein